jgi:hypothetical protein
LAIAFRASTEAHVTSGSLTVTIPSAVQAGDVMLLVAGMNDAGVTANDWSTPSGWTSLGTHNVGSNLFAGVWVRVATAGDAGATVTLATSGTGKACAIIAAYSGADPASPVNVSSVVAETTSTTSHSTPSVTTTLADTRVVIAAVQSNSATESWGTASGYTKRQDSIDNVNLGGHVTATVQDKAAATVGNYGGEALVAASTSSKAIMATVALAPLSTTQTSRPVSDEAVSDVIGVPTPGAGSGIYARLAADVDTSYAEFSDGGSLEVGMAALSDPASSSNHTVSFRARYAAGATGGTLTTTVKQGDTTIASWEDELTADWADYSHTLTSGEADDITDYAELDILQSADLS